MLTKLKEELTEELTEKLTDQEKIHIEEIRRRTKDNKAASARFFLKYALDSLDKLRNILFLSSFALIGYLGAVNKSPNKAMLSCFVVSIALGFTSYIFLYLFNRGKSRLYTDLEKNMSYSGFLVHNPYSHYNEMLGKEDQIYDEYKNVNIWHIFQVVSVMGQCALLVIFAMAIL